MAKRWLIGGAFLLVTLLVASVVVVLLETEERLAEGTPEEMVQRFVTAIAADEMQLAYSYLSEDLKETCAFEEFAGPIFPGRIKRSDERITLRHTEILDETAVVTVRVTQFRQLGPEIPFGTSESSYDERFTLAMEDGVWRFTQYPRPFYRCRPLEPMPRPQPVPQPPQRVPRK